MGILDDLHEKYQRIGKLVDKEVQDDFVARIGSAPSPSVLQKVVIAKCLSLGDHLKHGDFNEIKSSSHQAKCFVCYDGISDVATGKTVCNVDEYAAVVLAYRWDWCSHQKMAAHREDEKSISRSVVKVISQNEVIVAITKQMPFPFRSRRFILRTIWSGPDPVDGSFLYCWEPFEEIVARVNLNFNRSSVRAKTTGFIKLTPTGLRSCEYLMIQRLESGGHIPVSNFSHILSVSF